jgi:hypothetical protein
MIKRMLMLIVMMLVLTVAPLTPASPVVAADPTTSITITKYDADGVTLLDQTTVDYDWMMNNLPVQGDGVTRYYHQGPTFDFNDLWDQAEMVNIDSRDMGTVMGTDVKDLCELLASGGAAAGDEIEIKASDGFSKKFAYEDVYSPETVQGKLVVCWYNGDLGFMPDYDTGMRLVFFAQTTNPDGKYVFGNWDMHETLAEEYWHYYVNYPDFWPSSSGLSVKWVNRINIFTGGQQEEKASDSLTVRANVVLEALGISLNRDTIDFGDVSPGGISPVETVGIYNTGNLDVDVTLQVSASDSTAQEFYERSLYIDYNPYNINTVIASIETGLSAAVLTQLQVPEDWTESGVQEAQFIFWAVASDSGS